MADLYIPNLDVFTNVFTRMSMFGSLGITAIILTVLSMVIITRDVEKWKILCMPTMLVIWIMGVPLGGLGILALFISIFSFAIETQSIGVIGNVVHGINEGTKGTRRGIGRVIHGLSGGLAGMTSTGRAAIERQRIRGKEKTEKTNQKQRSEINKIFTKLTIAKQQGTNPTLTKKEYVTAKEVGYVPREELETEKFYRTFKESRIPKKKGKSKKLNEYETIINKIKDDTYLRSYEE